MIHIHITLQVVGLIEISFRVTLSTAEMHKVDTSPQRVIIPAKSLRADTPNEPVHRHKPLDGLGTASTNFSKSSSVLMIRGKPRIGCGGSSGWITNFTPTSSATGQILSERK